VSANDRETAGRRRAAAVVSLSLPLSAFLDCGVVVVIFERE
jgi:hypothetical protein